MTNVYEVNMRDFEFLMWEQLKIQDNLLRFKAYETTTQKYIRNLLLLAKQFAYEQLGPNYQISDSDGCQWVNATTITIPTVFYDVWPKYKKAWSALLFNDAIPMLVKRFIIEMFMGANPAFMTYSGFGPASTFLLETFGTSNQKALFIDALKDANFSACFCLTETQAGSDISAISASAEHIGDDQYLIRGEKIFISAGMHDLHENILYFVVAKTKSTESTYGLSCFIVPKYKFNADGSLGELNDVRCVNIVDKMGFKGCVNATLQFGSGNDCVGYLLGGKENIALQQIIHLMHEARISTGLFALGMSSSAFLNSSLYAEKRIQGRRYAESFNPVAPRIKIAQHPDVKRMLLEMKSKTEGFRALIAKLAFHESIIKAYEIDANSVTQTDKWHSQCLIHLLNPVIKAYCSDEAWRVSELAIQVVGGNGYLSDYPFEQYARDIKVLSIWEGTNYIQSQSLVREKLQSGANLVLFQEYLKEMNNILTNISNKSLQPEINLITDSLSKLECVLTQFNAWRKLGNFSSISGHSTLFLKMMAECSISTLHLQAIDISIKALSFNDLSHADTVFYQEKIASCKFYIWHHLLLHQSYVAIIKNNKVDYEQLCAAI